MRHSIRMLTIAALLLLGLASFGVAQMMGGNHDHSSMDEADSSSRSGMMNMMKTGTMDKMCDMSQNCKMMSKDLDKLQEHFDAMMQMDDIGALKTEMKKYQGMMQAMQDKMSEHQSMCMSMMSKMKSGGRMDSGMKDGGGE